MTADQLMDKAKNKYEEMEEAKVWSPKPSKEAAQLVTLTAQLQQIKEDHQRLQSKLQTQRNQDQRALRPGGRAARRGTTGSTASSMDCVDNNNNNNNNHNNSGYTGPGCLQNSPCPPCVGIRALGKATNCKPLLVGTHHRSIHAGFAAPDAATQDLVCGGILCIEVRSGQASVLEVEQSISVCTRACPFWWSRGRTPGHSVV